MKLIPSQWLVDETVLLRNTLRKKDSTSEIRNIDAGLGFEMLRKEPMTEKIFLENVV